ncbi:unnamed protein product [Arabidopsis lyrata]|uniref:uncharacterized protein LOC9327333 n=1 Tax=Arabidopsis lyrata subsp. lyrata TaxID=81972 RepID=UPI000A29D787|nr:uncharacterized protein LOC9327333 [Arabidopsis lyrata subsp. lyrata]CAH8254628.1 unnamed protein product [Arabidopsis lyrata]|eukprot:XP_020870458.1 uncharacterized protein LOC9327333 [Arabidopsis lyrata subsp. lyrata]
MSLHIKAPVCQTCGDIGFEEALVFCDSCKIESIHRYCIGITPTPFTEYITWICEDCDASDSDSYCNEVDQTAKLTHILKKKKKKKKKRRNRTPLVLAEDNGLQDATNVEPVEGSFSPIQETVGSKREESSGSRKPHELTGLDGDRASVSEADKSSSVPDHSSCTSKRKEVDQTGHNLEKSEKKKKKKKKKSSNHSPPVLAVEEHEIRDTTNVEHVGVSSSSPTKEMMESKRQENSDSRKPHELTGLVGDRASVSETANSSSVPDYNSCVTKKRKLSSGSIPVAENRQLADGNSSCKVAESNTPQTTERLSSRHYRAQPIKIPIWRGLMSVKGGNNCIMDGIVAHVSSLACPKVHETASSLKGSLSAEVLPRLEVWPKTFLKNGGPKDESIALFFFPSSESNDEKVFNSLVDKMKTNDSAMRFVLNDAELLLFTSYMLPKDSWTFNSKYYLWGVFKPRQTSRH